MNLEVEDQLPEDLKDRFNLRDKLISMTPSHELVLPDLHDHIYDQDAHPGLGMDSFAEISRAVQHLRNQIPPNNISDTNASLMFSPGWVIADHNTALEAIHHVMSIVHNIHNRSHEQKEVNHTHAGEADPGYAALKDSYQQAKEKWPGWQGPLDPEFEYEESLEANDKRFI